MNLAPYLPQENELPLDRIPDNGGYCAIFRTIGCIGDSLSSGEFESMNEAGERSYHDMFEYSWGQYIARAAGCKVYNFSRGGMTAQEYWESFAEQNGFWSEDKLCQAYILAMGVNDLNRGDPIGSAADICREDWTKNAPTFAGYFAKIIQRLKSMQPEARFFLMTMPRSDDERQNAIAEKHAALMRELASFFDRSYVLDFNRYAPVYDAEFRKNFYLCGHLNPMGYLLTGRMTAAYIDYIVRHNMEDFAQVGFIGKRPAPALPR